jgi:hypothetical protein
MFSAVRMFAADEKMVVDNRMSEPINEVLETLNLDETLVIIVKRRDWLFKDFQLTLHDDQVWPAMKGIEEFLVFDCSLSWVCWSLFLLIWAPLCRMKACFQFLVL